MKQKLELIVKKGRIIALAGLMSLTIGCASSRFYVEPKVGLIAPISAKEQTYNPSTTVGGALGLSGKVIGLEASLDSFNSSAEYIKTKSSLSRVNLNFSLSKAIYLTGGVGFLKESSVISIPEFNVHDKVKNNTTGIEFGIGATIFDRINTRISYILIPRSENARGMIIFTCGYQIGSKK
jgi:hypothetical protein